MSTSTEVLKKYLPVQELIDTCNKIDFNVNDLKLKQIKIIDTKNENVKIIQFNSSDTINSIDINMLKEFLNIGKYYDNKFLVFLGEKSNRYFCTGANLKSCYNSKNFEQYFLELSNLSSYVFYKFYKDLQNNTLFIWNGVTMGGGLAVGIYSKFKVATESTILAMPESVFGFHPNGVFSHFIEKIVKKNEAFHMALFSHKYRGYEVYLKGFSNYFILNKYIPELLQDIEEIKSNNMNSYCIDLKKVLDAYHLKSVAEYSEKQIVENDLQKTDDLINKLYDFEYEKNNFLDFYEGLKYNLKKLKLNNLFIELEKRSILSLKVNFEIVSLAYESNLDYLHRLNKDLEYAKFLVETGNINEGINSYFVRKDQLPRWRAKF